MAQNSIITRKMMLGSRIFTSNHVCISKSKHKFAPLTQFYIFIAKTWHVKYSTSIFGWKSWLFLRWKLCKLRLKWIKFNILLCWNHLQLYRWSILGKNSKLLSRNCRFKNLQKRKECSRIMNHLFLQDQINFVMMNPTF